MQELYFVLFVAVVAFGAYFAFKKPKKTNPWSGRSGSGGDEQGGGETPTGVETVTPISFSGDVSPTPIFVEENAPKPRAKKTTKPRKKYGTKITKPKK